MLTLVTVALPAKLCILTCHIKIIRMADVRIKFNNTRFILMCITEV